jgi:hypothetical protein
MKASYFSIGLKKRGRVENKNEKWRSSRADAAA